jgi:phenylpropionate dioxygenase-like ring-hydroxylating dioxygenase large terminal subunit
MTFIRNSWYVASWSAELTDSKPVAVTMLDEPLVLFRTLDGTATALRDCCCHRNAPLSHGRCENGLLRCMYHGLMFDGTGKCVLIPGQTHIPAACRVPSYPTVEQHGAIWVWMGDPAQADPRLLPFPACYDTREWEMPGSHWDLQANYMLMNDNLADLSHVAFLHEATFGAGDTRIAETHPTITQLERGIRVERWLTDRSQAQDWIREEARPASAAEAGGRQELWLSYELLAPGVFVMLSELHPVGVAQDSGYATPGRKPVHANLNFQAMTPIDETSTRHFFALGPPRAETLDHPTLADDVLQASLKGFEEDRRMLEAQQRNLARWPIRTASAIRHDRGPQLLRRVIDRLIRLENGPSSAGESFLKSPSMDTASSPLEKKRRPDLFQNRP